MTVLLGIQQVDPWLQFNPHILSGYRPRMSTRDALRSFFAWHNESFNIWSHTLAAFFVFYLAIYPPRVDFTIPVATEVNDARLVTPHYRRRDAYEGAGVLVAHPTLVFRGICLALIFTFLSSAAYHMFMPCASSETSYRRLMNCDVFGVLTSITGSSWSFLYYGNACSIHWIFHSGVLLIVLLISFVVVTYSTIFAVHCGTRGRTKAIGLHLLLRLCFLLWLELPKSLSQGYHQALSYHTLSFILVVIGGTANALRFPEKHMQHIARPSSSSSSTSPLAHARTEKEENNRTVLGRGMGMISVMLSRCWHWMGQYVISGEEIDYAWNSHNLWHYCVILSATSTLLACYYDIEEFELARC